MPLFFIDITDGDRVVQDREGEDFLDLDAVRQTVILAAREIMAEGVNQGIWWRHRRISVRDDAGNVVLTMPLSDALSDR